MKERTQQLQDTLTGLENQLSQVSLKHSEDVERATERHRQMEMTVSVHITAGLYAPYLPPPNRFIPRAVTLVVLQSNTLRLNV